MIHTTLFKVLACAITLFAILAGNVVYADTQDNTLYLAQDQDRDRDRLQDMDDPDQDMDRDRDRLRDRDRDCDCIGQADCDCDQLQQRERERERERLREGMSPGMDRGMGTDRQRMNMQDPARTNKR